MLTFIALQTKTFTDFQGAMQELWRLELHTGNLNKNAHLYQVTIRNVWTPLPRVLAHYTSGHEWRKTGQNGDSTYIGKANIIRQL